MDSDSARALLLTVLLGLKADLLPFLLALRVGERQAYLDGVIRGQISESEAWSVVLHGQAFSDRGVVPAAAPCGRVAVAQGDGVRMAAGQVEGRRLPQQVQLTGLDLRSPEITQRPHGLC